MYLSPGLEVVLSDVHKKAVRRNTLSDVRINNSREYGLGPDLVEKGVGIFSRVVASLIERVIEVPARYEISSQKVADLYSEENFKN